MNVGNLQHSTALAPTLRSSADGWRGRIGTEFNPRTAGLIVEAILDRIRAKTVAPRLLVAFDCRKSGRHIALDLAELIAGTLGAPPTVVQYLPTPTASFLTRNTFDYALLVTASHNPPDWNGIKLKTPNGQPASADFVAEVDQLILEDRARLTPWSPDNGERAGSVSVDDAEGYCAQHFAHILHRLRRQPPHRHKVVIDGLAGICGSPMCHLGQLLGWTIVETGCEPDPEFDGSQPDPSIPGRRSNTQKIVRETGADFGVVLDGDGDRVYFVDDTGTTVQPHDLLALLLRHEIVSGSRIGRIGVTQTVGMSLRLEAKRLGLPLLETPIGFKYLAPLLANSEIDLAGGAVGDIAISGWSTDRDPFAAVAIVSEMLTRSELPLSLLVSALRSDLAVQNHTWFECRTVPKGMPSSGDLLRVMRKLADRCGLSACHEQQLPHGAIRIRSRNNQWLLIRPSTTEGGLRLYGEVSVDKTPDIARWLTVELT